MKNLTITLALLTLVTLTHAQSDSFLKFKEKFGYTADVHSFKTNGFVLRTVLAIAGEDEIRTALRHIGKIRLIVVPRAAFEARDVTVAGYKRELWKDGYEQMMNVRDGGSDVTIFERGDRDERNRYMVLVEDGDEVILVEVMGYVDREYLKSLFLDEMKKEERS